MFSDIKRKRWLEGSTSKPGNTHRYAVYISKQVILWKELTGRCLKNDAVLLYCIRVESRTPNQTEHCSRNPIRKAKWELMVNIQSDMSEWKW